MMQDYTFSNSSTTSFETASTKGGNSQPVATCLMPSAQVVQKILQYARCYQNIRIGDVNIKVYLN